MLAEAWMWLRARCTAPARRLGHLAEAIALDARAKRQRLPWQDHLAHTRAAILQVAAQCPSRRCAVVLGSGSCHDVPLAELSAQFERVLLVDIVHLPAVLARSKSFPNVQTIQADLTGVADWLAARRGCVSADELAALVLAVPPVLQKSDIDFVASVNLLSQLPVKPVEYLQRNSPTLALTDLNAFAWRLLRAHVAALQTLTVPVCLVTDDWQRTWNRQQQLVEQTALVQALGLSDQVFARWRWPLAPVGELPDGHHAEHEVVAIRC
ncbi:hypothetical protein HPT27_14580 [Permianibacter sp. IMCC34836]|uniref:hypothetical protein n=1 Tax=Permianibacter fluminis TaxID=2738515 RepID=UPI001551DD4A|nr:hypothetical protein [Permianibacter fluminis]NQD38251.1 hypothetical protein [Permianibacter fluminis]